jgi:hypothetical protein
VEVKAMVFDGDDRVLEIRRNRIERHVAPLLIEAEPGPARCVIERRVANAAV